MIESTDHPLYHQGMLQDYLDCPYRYYLRYRIHLLYPAVETEPVLEFEEHIRKGMLFHRAVQQFLIGVPIELIENGMIDPVMRTWWQDWQSARKNLPGLADDSADWMRYPEISLTAVVDDVRLTGKFDLLAILPDRQAVIYDWKTSHAKLRPHHIAARAQTRIYPLLLWASRAGISGLDRIPLDQIQMVYWSIAAPNDPLVFQYGEFENETDRLWLVNLTRSIEALPDAGFPQTTEVRRCAYCVYRSFCERGTAAGSLLDTDTDEEILTLQHLDLDRLTSNGDDNS